MAPKEWGPSLGIAASYILERGGVPSGAYRGRIFGNQRTRGMTWDMTAWHGRNMEFFALARLSPTHYIGSHSGATRTSRRTKATARRLAQC